MKYQQVERHLIQILKIRAHLKAGWQPWQLIKKPKGMKSRDFNRKIERLKKKEKLYSESLEIYLRNYMSK